MAKITNTFLSSDAKGVREDLSNKIFDITPEETPYTSAIDRGTMDNTFTEWQQDALAAVDTNNFKPEGDDVTAFAAVVPTVRLGVYAQISRKEWIIAETTEAVERAGRKAEMAYVKARKMLELRLDVEAITLQNQITTGTDPRKTAGLGAWIKSNTSKGVGGVDPVYTTLPNNARTDGTQRAFSKALTDVVVAACYNAGATPKIIMVGAANKQLFSGFGGIATQMVQINGPKQTFIMGGASVYVSDFGNIAVIPNRNQRARDAWFLNPEFAQIAFLRNYTYKELATTGDAQKRMIVVEWAHKVLHEKAHGLVADLS